MIATEKGTELRDTLKKIAIMTSTILIITPRIFRLNGVEHVEASSSCSSRLT